MSEITLNRSDETWCMLTAARELHKPVDALIRSIYEKRVAWGARQTAYQQKMRCAFATVKEDPYMSSAWKRLLNHLGHHGDLPAILPMIPYLGPQPGNTGLDGLLMLVLRCREWLRQPEEWESATSVAREQYGSLARHLLCRYKVPAFMDAAWFEGFTQEGHQHRNWFMHIGLGHNLRTADVPVRLTSKAAHHFSLAPDDFAIVCALRWGQTLALGGEDYLARAIAASRLSHILPDEPFWFSVIHFFVNNHAMDTSQVGPIVDFVYNQKFGDYHGPTTGRPVDCSDAPDPEFTMKGRTLAALQKRVEEWHEAIGKEAKRPRMVWEPSGIEPFRVEERDMHGTINTWTIVELLDSKALKEDGCEMRHCVRTYAEVCLRGTCSIWSLRARPLNDARTRRLLTIEVNNARRAIVQVRGRCNQAPGASRGNGRMKTACEMLRRWAREQRLSIACNLS